MKGTKLSSGLLSLAVAICLTVLCPSGLFAASPNHTKQDSVEDFDIIVPADEGCSGEDVHIFGTLDVTIQTTVDGKGNLHVMFHLTPHLQGVGLTTGLDYNPNGPSNFIVFADANGTRISKGVNIINLISPGSAGNLVLKEQINVTVNANGVTTVSYDEIKGGCKG